MKINIITAYRPLCSGGLNSPPGELQQLPDGKWRDQEGRIHNAGEFRYGEDEIVREIRFLNKNSFYKHHIVIVIDSDVYPNNTWLKEFDNVTILKCPYVHTGPLQTLAINRLNAALKYGIDNIADDDWLCYSYISDLICGKNWDKPIIDAIQKYGEKYVYVPMFTEIKGGISDRTFIGIQPTPQFIWEDMRKYCCHSLIMPIPRKELFFTEADMDNFIKISDQYPRPPVIIEKPGDRIYGYFVVMFMKAKYGKKAMKLEGSTFDLYFDNRLYSECNLMKAVITNSYVFHPSYQFRE